MKNRLLLMLIIVGLIFSLSATTTIASEVLREGSRGASVQSVQEKLHQAGYEVTIDGIFGIETREAVEEFQSEEDLTSDGVVGPKTIDNLQRVIQESEEETTTYTVNSGDTLSNIASKFDVEVDKIMQINGLTDYNIYPDDELEIPSNNDVASDNNEDNNEQETSNEEKVYHEVKRGDSLSLIANQHDVEIEEIQRANDISGDRITAGDELVIPVEPDRSGSSSRESDSTSLQWPIKGEITSGFGNRTHPVTRERDFHSGIDISASYGERIEAAEDGTVVHSGWMGGYGYTIVIDHGDGKETLYAHNSQLHVSQGEQVSQGDVIAAVGNTGVATGSHLHFEVIEQGEHRDPKNYLP